MNAALLTSLASVLVAGIAAAAAIASQRAAANAAIRNTDTTSRSAIEAEAFERAKSYYTDTIDRQAAEISGLESDVASLRSDLKDLRADFETSQRELETAKRALRLAFPDEP